MQSILKPTYLSDLKEQIEVFVCLVALKIGGSCQTVFENYIGYFVWDNELNNKKVNNCNYTINKLI